MKRHTTIDLDPDLVECVKLLGGRGIIKKLCNETLLRYVYEEGEYPNLSIGDQERIKHVRAIQDQIRGELEIMRDCWHHHVKQQFGPAVARYGLRKVTLEIIIDSSKEWMFDKYGRLPTDHDIEQRFKGFYQDEFLYWQTERMITFKSKQLMEDETITTAEEYNRTLADWVNRNKVTSPKPHSELLRAAEVSNGRS